MKKLTEFCLYDAREGLLNRDFTSKELVLDHIAVMESSRSLNAFITETPEIAIRSAIENKPKGHDFIIDRNSTTKFVSRHMNVTGG